MILQAGVTGGAMAGTTLADGGHRWRPDTPVGDGGDSGDGGDGGDGGGGGGGDSGGGGVCGCGCGYDCGWCWW